MTSAIHDVHWPTRSVSLSVRARRPPAAPAPCPASGATDTRVIDRFAVTRPTVVLRLERHVRVVDLAGDRVLRDAFLEHFLRRNAQAFHDVVRQRPRDYAVFLDELLHRLGVGALAPGFADHVAGGA